LIRINDLVCPGVIVLERWKEVVMPTDALIVSLAVTIVFVGFAAVLAWADHQTKAVKADVPAPKRRSF
jgi:hypothetical protein